MLRPVANCVSDVHEFDENVYISVFDPDIPFDWAIQHR